MRYGKLLAGSGVVGFVDSAEPLDLEAKVADLIAQASLGLTTPRLFELNIAGSGDGHRFTVAVGVAAAAALQGGLALSAPVRFYLAGDAQNLSLARTAAIARAGSPPDLADEQLAGASKGLRVMGALLYGTWLGGTGACCEQLLAANPDQTHTWGSGDQTPQLLVSQAFTAVGGETAFALGTVQLFTVTPDDGPVLLSVLALDGIPDFTSSEVLEWGTPLGAPSPLPPVNATQAQFAAIPAGAHTIQFYVVPLSPPGIAGASYDFGHTSLGVQIKP